VDATLATVSFAIQNWESGDRARAGPATRTDWRTMADSTASTFLDSLGTGWRRRDRMAGNEASGCDMIKRLLRVWRRPEAALDSAAVAGGMPV